MGDVLTNPVVLLFAGVFALLAAATLIGRRMAMGADAADADRAAMIANLNDRIVSWWVIVGLLAVAFLAGRFATILLFALVSFWCLREFISLTPTPVADHYALAAAFYVFLPMQYLLLGSEWLNLFTILIPVYGYLLLPAIAVLWGETRDFLLRISKVQWALMLAVYCLSHVPAVLILNIPGAPAGNFGLLAFLLIVVQGSDVAQYVFGKSFGRRKIAPRVSPGKTWEGFIGGGATATLLGAALWWVTPFSPLQALGMAFAVVLAGSAGGLVLSAVKRSLGAKDWGSMVEGHGGMLDRMDSLAFAAPIFFHLTNYYFAI
jgi:phosphatidate cytidylyltransferase